MKLPTRHAWALALLLATPLACNTSIFSGVNVHNGGTLTGQNFWEAGTHRVSGTTTVENGALTIAAGAVLEMAAGASIVAQNSGSLQIVGNTSNLVTITAANSTAAWGSIVIDASSDGTSTITYATLSNGGATHGMLYLTGGTATLTDATFQNAVTFGLQMDGASLLNQYAGNTFSKNTLGAVAADADSVQTLAGSNNIYDSFIHVGVSTLHADAQWADVGAPYLLDGLTVSSGTSYTAMLTVDPNVTLLMNASASIVVDQAALTGNGGLNFAGTAAQPIWVTSVNAAPQPGDWQSISFTGATEAAGLSTVQSFVDNVVVQYGGTQNAGAIAVGTNAYVSITNTTVSNALNAGLSIQEGALVQTSSGATLTFTDNGGVAVDTTAAALATLTVAPLVITASDSSGGYPGIRIAAGTLADDAEWIDLGPNVAYILAGTLNVDGGLGATTPVLTLDAGVTLYVEAGADINFLHGAQFQTLGTQAAAVTISAASPTAGWGSIKLGADSLMQWTSVSYGGASSTGAQVYVGAGTLTTSHCTFSHTAASSPYCDLTVGTSGALSGTISGTKC